MKQEDTAVPETPLLVAPSAGRYRACGCNQRLHTPLCPTDCRKPEASAPFRVRRDGARIWLCRCGRTRTPPHCDGAHNRRK